MRCTVLTVVMLLLTASQSALANEPQTIAVLDTELIVDMKQTPYAPNPDDVVRRAGYLTQQVRKALDMSEHYRVVPLQGAQETVDRVKSAHQYLHECNDCELEIGRALGTDLIADLWVQQVSNLIINLNMVVKDVKTGKTVKTSFVDIRGNTNGSWMNGTTYMLRNFFDKYHMQPPENLEQTQSVWPD